MDGVAELWPNVAQICANRDLRNAIDAVGGRFAQCYQTQLAGGVCTKRPVAEGSNRCWSEIGAVVLNSDISDRMPESFQIGCQISLSDRKPEFTSNRMPEKGQVKCQKERQIECHIVNAGKNVR